MATASPTARPSPYHMKGAMKHGSPEKRKSQLRDDSILSTDSTVGDDPLRILLPTQKKLSSVESQRVLSVLDECIKRIEIVSALPHLINSLDRHSVSLGADLTSLLIKYKILTEEFRQTVMALGKDSYGDIRRMSSEMPLTASMCSISSEKSLAAISKTRLDPIAAGAASTISSETLDEKLLMLTDQIKHSTKSILRSFSSNPTAFGVVKAASGDISYGAKSFKSSLVDLRTIVQERLLTTKQEEETRCSHVDQMSKRERELTNDIVQLEEELSIARELRDEEIGLKSSQINSLKSDISTVDKLSQEANRRVQNEATEQQDSDLAEYEKQKEKLMGEVGELKKSLDSMVTTNRESELLLRKKTFKRETEVENWVQRYDSEMGEKQDELEDVNCNYEQEKTQLKELEERFKVLEEEYTVIMEEKRIAREKAEKAANELQKMARAATVIQAFWRSYKCRKMLKKDQKGKGKGKKGKGKKGSGKKKKK